MNFDYMARGSFGYEGSSIVAILKSNGEIYEVKSTGEQTLRGYSVERVKELQERLDNYYSKLVELGVIKPELTPEQAMAKQLDDNSKQQAEINKNMLEAIEGLTSQLKILKEANNELVRNDGNANSAQNISEYHPAETPTDDSTSETDSGKSKFDTRRKK